MFRCLSVFGSNKRIFKPIIKLYTIIRDNTVVYFLNKLGCPIMAKTYNYITTEATDTIILAIGSKVGITSISSKYILLIIFSFLL